MTRTPPIKIPNYRRHNSRVVTDIFFFATGGAPSVFSRMFHCKICNRIIKFVCFIFFQRAFSLKLVLFSFSKSQVHSFFISFLISQKRSTPLLDRWATRVSSVSESHSFFRLRRRKHSRLSIISSGRQ